MSDDQILRECDWDAVFTNDPTKFIDMIALSLMSDTEPTEQVLQRQRLVFKKWLGFYSSKYRETIAQSVEAKYAHRYANAIRDAEYKGYVNGLEKGKADGRIITLRTLPLKKGILGTIVDLNAINKELNNAKGSTSKLA